MKEIAKSSAKGRLVANVLAGSWRRSVSPAIGITESQLDEVTPLLCASGGAALGWWRMKETTLRATPSGEVLHQAYRLQALQSGIHEQKIKKVFHLLRQANVEPILAKGWAASNLYPDRALRAYGDIDLLVREQDIARTEEVLASKESSDCWVDLHGRFSELPDRTVDNLFERSRLADLDGDQIRVLSDEDHLALLAIHLLKHGAWRPLWLCDIAAAIESTPKDFDWEICLGRDKGEPAGLLSRLPWQRNCSALNRTICLKEWMRNSLVGWSRVFLSNGAASFRRIICRYSRYHLW